MISGEDTEVLLHDVSDLDHSIVAILNGGISGRSVGGPAMDLVLSILETPSLWDGTSSRTTSRDRRQVLP